MAEAETTAAVATTGQGVADISALDVQKSEGTMEVRGLGGEVLRHPDGRPFTITFLSRDSDQFVALARSQADRRTQQMLRTRSATMAATQEKDAIDLLVAVTVKWDIVLEGKKAESKPEAFRSAYNKYPALREQADEFLNNRANFLKG